MASAQVGSQHHTSSSSSKGPLAGPRIEQPIAEEQLKQLLEDGTSYAFVYGLLYFPGGQQKNVKHLPFTLVPTRIPRTLYVQGTSLAERFNLLVHRASLDVPFIEKSLSSSANVDPFTTRLLDLLRESHSSGIPQKISFNINRSDYMLSMTDVSHAQQPRLLQVEHNTIAAAGFTHSQNVSHLHKYLIARNLSDRYDSTSLAVSNPADGVIESFARAWSLYGSKSAIILLVCLPVENNLNEHHRFVHRLQEEKGITVIRKTLTELADSNLRTVGSQRRLYLGDREVAIVYFRAGYDPSHFASEREWKARKTLELSFAIKAPSVAYHLLGSKKMQQVFAEPGVLERFFPEDSDSVKALRGCFAGLYSLDPRSGRAVDEIIARAAAHPQHFVLKPDREGGGNNLYGEQLQKALHTMSREQLAGYILMDRIRPVTCVTYVARDHSVTELRAVSELGFYAAFLADGPQILLNSSLGHLLRTKSAELDEGGIFGGGGGAFDGVYLTDAPPSPPQDR